MTFASTDILSSIHLKGYFRQRQPLHDVNILNLLKRDPQASINVWADYWYNKIGVNVIPADTKNKMPTEKWTEWQDKPISEEVHQEWKDKNRYSNGIALIPGKVWRGPNSGKFLVFIDLDNQKAIDEVCTSFNCSNLEYLANYVIVEQHQDNKSKAHLYFYSDHIFTKKSSDVVKMKDGILNNEIPAIEVKGSGEHGIACCSPSIHKDGNKYEIIGTMEPKTYGKEIEISLFEIYKKYNLGTNNQGKIPIERLFDTDFIVSEGHNRHEALLRVMESLIQRNKIMLSLEQIRNMAIEWNNIHCNPPLDDKEFEKQWIDASDYIHKQESNSSVTPSSKINRYITKKINDNPEVYYYADRIEKKIGSYKIVDKIDKTSGKDIKEKIFGNRIIGAIPKRIFIYNDNPLLQKSLEKTKIIFETPKDEEYEIGPYDSNELIIRELGNKYLVINKRRADEALSCIINAYRENGIVEYLDGLTTGGYYLINNNIKTVGSLQNISNDFDKDTVKRCIDFLDYLATCCWKNKNIFPTILKWGIISPFSFIIKSNSDNWLPWLQLYGCGQTGKTTLGYIILSIWNLEKRIKSIGFNDMDTPARFGQAVSRDTYPILVNEVGALFTNSNGKQTSIAELIKHSVENITCRSKFYEGKYFQETLALSPMILTCNYTPPNDGSHNRRFISMHFPEDEKKEKEAQEEFKKQFDDNKRSLAILGDFTASYIRDNPSILLNKDWNNIAIEILKKFYELVDMPIPSWIDLIEEQRDAIEESSEKTLCGLRAFLLNKINEACSRSKDHYDEHDKECGISHKLEHCLKNNLISFLPKPKENDVMIIITIDIMNELKKNSIENLTALKDVGNLLGFKYVNINHNKNKMRVLRGNKEDFIKFIDIDTDNNIIPLR